jgi:hypothetical protein
MKTSVVTINKTKKEKTTYRQWNQQQINKNKQKKEERKRKEGKNISVLIRCLCRSNQGKYTYNTWINRLILLVTTCVVRNSGFCLLALDLFICSVPFSQTKSIISLNSINLLLLITDTEYFLCVVRNNIRFTESPMCKQPKNIFTWRNRMEMMENKGLKNTRVYYLRKIRDWRE